LGALTIQRRGTVSEMRSSQAGVAILGVMTAVAGFCIAWSRSPPTMGHLVAGAAWIVFILGDKRPGCRAWLPIGSGARLSISCWCFRAVWPREAR